MLEGKFCCLIQNTLIRNVQWQLVIFDQCYCWVPTAQGSL